MFLVRKALNTTAVFPGGTGGGYQIFLQGMLSARLKPAELWNVPEI